MTQTLRYGLPLLQSGQAQKEITHNDAVSRLDLLLHLTVESRRTATPPATPVNGTAWVVAVGATGSWAGHVGEIAAYADAGTSFTVPQDGCVAYVRDEGVFSHFRQGAWQDRWPVAALSVGGRAVLGGSLATVAAPGGGSVVDVEGRAAFSQLLTALRGLNLIA